MGILCTGLLLLATLLAVATVFNGLATFFKHLYRSKRTPTIGIFKKGRLCQGANTIIVGEWAAREFDGAEDNPGGLLPSAHKQQRHRPSKPRRRV